MKTKKLLSFLLTITTVVSMMATLGVTANAGIIVPTNEEYLDLDDSTTDIKDKKELDQNYKLTVTNNYTDMTKVKVEWTVTDINATRKDAKVWDPDTLSWVDDNENDVVTPGDTTASFKITNLSTVKVDAKVEFAAVTGFTPEVVYTGVDATTHKTTVNTVVKADKSVDNTITHDVTVTVKVTPAKADFADKTATTTATKYGTYTVTISKATAD